MSLRSLAFLALLLPLSGCVSLVQHQANTHLVGEMGLEEVQKEVKIVTLRARDPQIVEVEFNDVGFVYTYNSFVPMSFVPTQGRLAVVFDNLERLDVYENNKVFLYEAGGRHRGTILFSTLEDAERWTDLVLSLQAADAAGG